MFMAAVVSAQKLYGYKNIIGRSLQSAFTNINHVREITSEVWSELKKILIITTATVLGKTHAYLAGGLAQATGQNLALQAVRSTALESIRNAAVDSIQNAAQNTVPEVLDLALFYSIETLATRALRVGKHVANTAEEHNIPLTPDFIKKVAGHPYVGTGWVNSSYCQYFPDPNTGYLLILRPPPREAPEIFSDLHMYFGQVRVESNDQFCSQKNL